MSNVSFKPSEFDKQAAASLDMIDEQAAAERVQKILHPEAVNSGGLVGALGQAKSGPTLTPQPQTQPQAPAPRKPRSDKGTHKPKAPADPDEIVLHLTLAEARNAAIACGNFGSWGISEHIHDQIIQQLQRRLDQLQKGAR